jgi:hypothetical protein
MPVHREGRFVTTSPEELNVWLGEVSGKPVHAAVETTDLLFRGMPSHPIGPDFRCRTPGFKKALCRGLEVVLKWRRPVWS